MRFDIRIQKVDLQQEVRHYIEPSIASLPESTRESTQGRERPRVRRQRSARRNRQSCRITAHPFPSEIVVMQEVDADLFVALDRATRRIGADIRPQVAP